MRGEYWKKYKKAESGRIEKWRENDQEKDPEPYGQIKLERIQK